MSLFGSYCHVVVMGNMTRDIEIRTTPSGKRVANITVAVSERIQRGNEWVDEPTFVDITVWEKTAELVERFGGKGKPILVEGRLRQEKWQDKATGQNRSKMVVVASGITFPSGSGGGGGGGGGSSQRSQGGGQPRRDGGNTGSRPPAGKMPYSQNLEEGGFDESYQPAPAFGDYEGGYAGGGDDENAPPF